MEIKIFAPIAFECTRTIIGIKHDDFLSSFQNGDLIHFFNTEKSGSQMYKTQDDVNKTIY